MKKVLNAQNIFLNKLRVDKAKVNLFLSNGVRLCGIIKGFDEFTIVLENDGRQTLVYKSSTISITPQNAIKPIKDDVELCLT